MEASEKNLWWMEVGHEEGLHISYLKMQRTLQKEDQNQLNKWLDAMKEFELLYKASRDGCSNTAFHQKCDNKGPTVTVFYNTSDCVFGGYTAMNWDASNAYKADPTAFLFRLYYKASWSPKKCPVMNGSNAIFSHSSYGPVFGSGHDINSFSGTIALSGTSFPLNGSLGLGSSYHMLGDDANTMMCSSLNCYDVEVYSLKDGSVKQDPLRTISEMKPKEGSVKQDHWRTITEMKPKTLKSDIETYSPIEGVKVGRANILLVGAVGSGKSSYFNTINSIFRGHVTSQACSGSAEQSLTNHYRKYKVRSMEAGGPLKLRLCDTRGLEEAQGLDSADVVAILDGHLPDKYMFNPAMAISHDSPGYKKSPTLGDKIHCVAIIIDGCSVDVFPEKILHNIKVIQQKANQRAIPQVIILTKVDKFCPHVAKDPGTLFYSSAISDLVGKVSELVGLPRAHVLPVKNYEKEMELMDSVDIPALISLRQMLRFADDYLYNFLDEDDD